MAPGGAGDSNPGPLGTKRRVLDHSAPRGHSPGKSPPRGIILVGNRPPGESPPGESFPWGITPLESHSPGNHPPGESYPWGIVPLDRPFPPSTELGSCQSFEFLQALPTLFKGKGGAGPGCLLIYSLNRSMFSLTSYNLSHFTFSRLASGNVLMYSIMLRPRSARLVLF